MRYGLADERLGLWHLARILGHAIGQVNEPRRIVLVASSGLNAQTTTTGGLIGVVTWTINSALIARKRIKDLSDYVASLQQKES
jgi:hypothetical protein